MDACGSLDEPVDDMPLIEHGQLNEHTRQPMFRWQRMYHDRALVGERAPAVAKMKGDDDAEVKRKNYQRQ